MLHFQHCWIYSTIYKKNYVSIHSTNIFAQHPIFVHRYSMLLAYALYTINTQIALLPSSTCVCNTCRLLWTRQEQGWRHGKNTQRERQTRSVAISHFIIILMLHKHIRSVLMLGLCCMCCVLIFLCLRV